MARRENPFPYSLDNKRYHTYNYELQKVFGGKVCKISLNAGFTCPNIDGTRGIGGCTYCSSAGSGDFGGNPKESIPEQFEKIRAMLSQKSVSYTHLKISKTKGRSPTGPPFLYG